MASGNTLVEFTAMGNQPPATAFAQIAFRGGTNIPVLAFDDTTDESAEFGGFMPSNYAGGGLTVTIGWMATDTTVTGGHQVRWDVGLKSVTDDADDLDTKAYAAVNSVSSDEASASGEVQYAEITFIDGADMDSVAAGEYFRMIVTRDANHADDDLTGDAELLFVVIKET